MKGERRTQASFFPHRVLLTLLLWAAASWILSVTVLGFFQPEEANRGTREMLTFAERVAYQRAIEEVYWRHRLWPKANLYPKPSLGAVMAQAQLENKVADYLRKSQALERYLKRPITAEELQAEMDRMATHTKQPDVLSELFEALGNDPFIIAECLARPVLVGRLSFDFAGHETSTSFNSATFDGVRMISAAVTAANGVYQLPTVSEGDTPCVDDTWTATSIPTGLLRRNSPSAIWTGSEMIVWGGLFAYITLNTGGRYTPATDSWTLTSETNAPSERYSHAAVWTGSEMIIWGGASVLLGGPINTGGLYNPATDTWTATTIASAPSARYLHTGVWTGSEMIVWGGYSGLGGSQLNTGGRYNPSTRSWTATSTTNAPLARQDHTAVWTDSEMIVWGGYLFDGSSHFLDNGGRYNPNTNSWLATSTLNAPIGRRFHTAVWAGDEMIVWGGQDANSAQLNTGGRYYPFWDAWVPTTTVNTPSARDSHTAVWTGNEMIVWGGYDGFANGSDMNRTNLHQAYTANPRNKRTPRGSTPTPSPTPIPTPIPPGTGGRYDPRTDTWVATSTRNAPTTRFNHASVWTGTQMIIWGGHTLGYLDEWDTGGRYCAHYPPTIPSPTPTPTPTPCTGRCTPTPRPRPIPREALP